MEFAVFVQKFNECVDSSISAGDVKNQSIHNSYASKKIKKGGIFLNLKNVEIIQRNEKHEDCKKVYWPIARASVNAASLLQQKLSAATFAKLYLGEHFLIFNG